MKRMVDDKRLTKTEDTTSLCSFQNGGKGRSIEKSLEEEVSEVRKEWERKTNDQAVGRVLKGWQREGRREEGRKAKLHMKIKEA